MRRAVILAALALAACGDNPPTDEEFVADIEELKGICHELTAMSPDAKCDLDDAEELVQTINERNAKDDNSGPD